MSWIRRWYRGNKVWVEVGSGGTPVLDDRGLVAMRYKPDDARTYTIRPGDLADLPTTDPDVLTVRTAVAFGEAQGDQSPPAAVGALLRWREHAREVGVHLGPTGERRAQLLAVRVALHAIRRPKLPVEIAVPAPYVLEALVEGRPNAADAALAAAVRRDMGRFRRLTLHVAGRPARETSESDEADREDALAVARLAAKALAGQG